MPIDGQDMQALVGDAEDILEGDEEATEAVDDAEEEIAEGEEESDGPTDEEVAERVGEMVEDGIYNPRLLDHAVDLADMSTLTAAMPEGDILMRAMNAVDPAGEGAEMFTDPVLVLLQVYQLLGGELGPVGGVEAAGDPLLQGDLPDVDMDNLEELPGL